MNLIWVHVVAVVVDAKQQPTKSNILSFSMNYWLMKSEPECYSIDDLKKQKIGHWDGVRNYQARNILRDQMKKGDLAFFYYSNSKPSGIAGIVKIVKEGYWDHTAADPKSEHPDPDSTPENPRWYMVDVEFVKKFDSVIPLSVLKNASELRGMKLLQKGDRLSVQPVRENEWKWICDNFA